ncbi:MAG TPA: DUF2905 domain-containing protein [Acidimicrobiia bacterium]
MRAGNILIAVGLVIALVGVGVRFGLFSWFGKLPGDIRIEGERSAVFIPIASMIVVSVAGSVILNVIARLFRGE